MWLSTMVHDIFNSNIVKNIKTSNEETKNQNYLTLPYVKGISEKTNRQLKNLEIKLINKKSTTLSTSLIKNKPKIEILNQTGLVYEIPCNCNEKYIGHTQRFFKKRLIEHKNYVKQKDTTKALANHLEKNPDHTINWNDYRLVCSETNFYKRLFKESLYIKKLGKLNLEPGTICIKNWGELIHKNNKK